MKYLIWSWRHSQWWGPDHSGYTSDVTEAGRYTTMEAATIMIRSGLPGNNVAIDEQLVQLHLAGRSKDKIESTLDAWRRL